MIDKLGIGKASPKGNRTNPLTNLNLLRTLLVDQIKEVDRSSRTIADRFCEEVCG